jgi:hypothetical protein
MALEILQTYNRAWIYKLLPLYHLTCTPLRNANTHGIFMRALQAVAEANVHAEVPNHRFGTPDFMQSTFGSYRMVILTR